MSGVGETQKISPTVGPLEFDGAGLPGQAFGQATFAQIAAATSSAPFLLLIATSGASQVLFENATDAEVTLAIQGPLRDSMRIKDPLDVPVHVITTVGALTSFTNDNPARRQYILPAGCRILVWPTTAPTLGKVRCKIYD